MGIYTNHALLEGYSPSSVYTDVEPFKGEHFNYHELGIIAATESAANRDAFMKAIALNELASVEQYGTDQVFYEAVNIKGIFDRIKAFFKKIIEKIHKIFHTFIAKMGSWFQSSKDFAKKYEKEIIKNWGLVKNDWEFNGYKFKKEVLLSTKAESEDIVNKIETAKQGSDTIENLLKATQNATEFETALRKMTKGEEGKPYTSKKGSSHWILDDGGKKTHYIKRGDKYFDTNTNTELTEQDKINSLKPAANNKGNTIASGTDTYDSGIDKNNIAKFRENFNEKGKDQIRYQVVESAKNGNLVATINCDFNDSGAYDAKEFTEELHKAFYGEDDKEDLEKKDIEDMYGSITGMINFMKDYEKIKSNLEKSERKVVKSIDGIIDAIDKAQNNVIKDKDENNRADNEAIVQISTVFQSFWGFVKECETQAFSTILQAHKDYCSQAKQIAVKVVGLNKKMTEESVDYSNYSDGGNFNSFIESVKLV
jgi:hypothetical protein